ARRCSIRQTRTTAGLGAGATPFTRGPDVTRTLQAAAAAAALLALARPAQAAPDARGVEFFASKIRPVLVKHRFECHSAQAAKGRGGLRLDSRDGVLRGGEKGPAAVPGQPDKSLIIKALRHDGLKMPSAKEKLPPGVVNDFVEWVAMGAPDPRDKTAS